MSTVRNITITLLVCTLTMFSCVKEELPSADTPHDNLEALWQILDERYCFFDYKYQELGVDWDVVHRQYAARVNDNMTRLQLFEVCCEMLAELHDGHVNLGASFDVGRNWSYWEDFPEQYYDSIARSYLGHDYGIASGLLYKVLDDNIAYVRCQSFSHSIGDGNISSMLSLLAPCSGMIIDLRNNGGGELTNAERLASHFTNERRLVGYVCHKRGKAHNEFSPLQSVYLDPARGIRWQKPVVVITNRQVFSAANDFVKMMHCVPGVTLLGDQTGGGSGMPFTQELPCGWSVRYSAVVFLDRDKQHIEFGIQPDIYVSMDMADVNGHRDTLIERARQILGSQ